MTLATVAMCSVKGTVSVKTNLEKSTGKTLPLLTEKETKDRIETAVIARAIDLAKAPLRGHRTLGMSNLDG